MATPASSRNRLSADDWIEAGLTVLAEDGLAGIKIERLAARLGVTKGSFYWHFEDLPTFVDRMAERWSQSRDAAQEAFVDTAPAVPVARLRLLMEELSNPQVWALERAVRAWGYAHDGVRARLEALDAFWFDQVRTAFRELGFSALDAEIRAKTLYYAGIGYIHTGSLGEPEEPRHREGLLDLLTARATLA